jgi:hypothetical protein
MRTWSCAYLVISGWAGSGPVVPHALADISTTEIAKALGIGQANRLPGAGA